ncbi:MAG: alpha/beta hydrolase [Bacteroidetes bacterium]|nr:alpha/beta hydrolase [Bacteroidota bacterium]
MDLLLIHGALGNAEQLKPLAERLAPRAVRCIELTGHGRSVIPAEGLSYEHFLSDIDAARANEGMVHLFGYSMGGYAALCYAARHPERVASVVTLGSKLLWDTAGLEALLQRLDADAIAKHVPKYAERLAADHGDPRWRYLVKATADLVSRDFHAPMLTPDVLARVECPVLICAGDQDDTALPADALRAAARMRDAGVLILPRTKHPVDRVDPGLLLPALAMFWAGREG